MRTARLLVVGAASAALVLAGSVAMVVSAGAAESQDLAGWRAAAERNKVALAQGLAAVDPKWAAGGQRDPADDLDDFVNTCSAIASGVQGDQLAQATAQRFSGGTGQVNAAQAQQLIDLARQYVCPQSTTQQTEGRPAYVVGAEGGSGWLSPEARAHYAAMWHLAAAERSQRHTYGTPMIVAPPAWGPMIQQRPPMPPLQMRTGWSTTRPRMPAPMPGPIMGNPPPFRSDPCAPGPYGMSPCGSTLPYPRNSSPTNCSDASGPMSAGSPGYSRRLDRDGDGIACEGR